MDNSPSSSNSGTFVSGRDEEYLGLVKLSPEMSEQREEGTVDLSRAPRKGRATWVRVGRQDQQPRARRRLFRSASPARTQQQQRRISRRRSSRSISRRRVNVSSINTMRPLRRQLLADFELFAQEISQQRFETPEQNRRRAQDKETETPDTV